MISPRDANLFRALCRKEDWSYYGPAVMRVAWPKTDLQILYGYMEDLHRTTDGDYTPADLRAYVESVARNDKLSGLAGILDAIAQTPSMDEAVLHKSVQQFVARQMALKAAQQIAQTHTDQDRFDPAEALELLQQATEIFAGRAEATVLDWWTSGLPSVEVDRPNRCPLGLAERLDFAVAGGIAAGEMCVFLAGPKKGKTSILSKIGAYNAKRGKRILHITLEVAKEMARARYDSDITGLDYDMMCLNPHVVETARRRAAEGAGSVQFVDWQYEDHSPSELIPLVRQYGPVDLLILDYLELMVPDRTKALARKEQRHLYSQLGKDIRGVVKLLGIPVITAWQVNRAGANADMVTERDISECWDIIKHADHILGISRSEEERRNGIVRIHTVLGRFSERRASVNFRADFERNQLEEIK